MSRFRSSIRSWAICCCDCCSRACARASAPRAPPCPSPRRAALHDRPGGAGGLRGRAQRGRFGRHRRGLCSGGRGSDRPGLGLYVDNEAHGDAYGPVAYLLPLPFDSGSRTGNCRSVPAAHAAAIAFDLLLVRPDAARHPATPRTRRPPARLRARLCLGGLSLHATRAPGQHQRRVGGLHRCAALAQLAGEARHVSRPGGGREFAPLALAPLLARSTGEERLYGAQRTFAAAFATIAVLSVALFLPDGGCGGPMTPRSDSSSVATLRSPLRSAPVARLGPGRGQARRPRPGGAAGVRAAPAEPAAGGGAGAAPHWSRQLAVDHQFYLLPTSSGLPRSFWWRPSAPTAPRSRDGRPQAPAGRRGARASAAPPPARRPWRRLTVGIEERRYRDDGPPSRPRFPGATARATAVAGPPLRRRGRGRPHSTTSP